MRTLLLTLAAAGALAVAGTASAGGWATAGVSAPPDDATAGSTWEAKITVLQHGRADQPLSGISPTITLVGKDGEKKTFAAAETEQPGVYLARVKFPSAGSWSYEVYDGFTQYGGAQTHTFGAISVGSPAGGSGIDLPSLPMTAGILLALGALIALALGMRRARPRPAPQL